MLILHSPEHGWKKCRCRECAGEAVPELPELRTTDASSFVQVGAVVPQDFKTRAVGEDG
jgi:hypothetical protein